MTILKIYENYTKEMEKKIVCLEYLWYFFGYILTY